MVTRKEEGLFYAPSFFYLQEEEKWFLYAPFLAYAPLFSYRSQGTGRKIVYHGTSLRYLLKSLILKAFKRRIQEGEEEGKTGLFFSPSFLCFAQA